MLKTDIVTPNQITGRAVYELVKGTKYVHVPYTFPELVITVEGTVIPLKRIPAGGSGDIGFPTDLAGIDLPNKLGLYWPSADQSAGGASTSGSQAVIVTSSFPIRVGGSQANIESPLTTNGLTAAGVVGIDSLPEFGRFGNFGALNVVAHGPEFTRWADAIITPTLGPLGGGWTAISGLFPTSGAAVLGDRSFPRVLTCDVSILAATVATCELLLTYWNAGDVVSPINMNLQPARISGIPGDTFPFPDVAVILRPSVPVLNGSEKTIKRAIVAETDTGKMIRMADVGPDPFMLAADDPAMIGCKLYCRSSGGGSLATVVNWSWAEEPAKGVF